MKEGQQIQQWRLARRPGQDVNFTFTYDASAAENTTNGYARARICPSLAIDCPELGITYHVFSPLFLGGYSWCVELGLTVSPDVARNAVLVNACLG